MKLQSEIEDIVCNLLSVVADEPQEQIDRDMSFDRFGLDSLARVGLITELSRKLGKSFDTEDAADCETPRELAKFIVQFQPSANPPRAIASEGSDTILWNRCRERDRYFTDLKSANRFVFEPVFSSNQGMRVESEGRSLLMMNSYNYLGYNDHPQVRAAAKAAIDEFGPGIHGSRVLAGTTTRHRQLEMSLAAVMNAEDAVIYNTGYVANLSTIQALLGKGDHIVCDQFCHASLIDGSQFSGASLTMFRHNDPESLRESLHGLTANVKLVVVEGVYSMEGDLAPLPEIVDVCRSEGAYLMVDEAHSFPVIGHTGRGVQEYFNLPADAIDIKMGTLSKGLSACGGFIAGRSELINYLRHQSRGYVFSGGLSTVQIAVAQKSLDLTVSDPATVHHLRNLAISLGNKLKSAGLRLTDTKSPIMPILCRTEDDVWEMCSRSRDQGLFVSPAVYPAVPKDKPRVRACVTALHTEADLDFATHILSNCAKEIGLIQSIAQ